MAERLVLSKTDGLEFIIVSLVSLSGEHLYLFGSYLKSDEAWRSQICEESLKCKNDCFDPFYLAACSRSEMITIPVCLPSVGSNRRVFKETQLCLALLYSLLSQYRLRDAQELGDHVASLVLHRAGHQKSPQSCEPAFGLNDYSL